MHTSLSLQAFCWKEEFSVTRTLSNCELFGIYSKM